MKVLMLSTDRSILVPGSKAAMRIEGYRSFADVRVLVVTPNIFKVLSDGGTIMAEWKPDVVSAQDPFMVGLIGFILARRANAPLQVQIHTDFMNPAYIYESVRHMIETQIARYVLARASCVRAVSARIADGARRLTSAPISVLPIRVSPPQAVAPRPVEFGDAPAFITVSRLAPEKRVRLAIDALMDVPSAHLYILGDGRERTSLEARARNSRVRDRVHFLGHRDDLAPYYRHATGFIQLSRYEGYGMALMEAALASCPIITTDVGVVGDTVPREDVRIVTDRTSLARAMTATITNPQKPHPPAVMTESEYHEAYAKALRTCVP